MRVFILNVGAGDSITVHRSIEGAAKELMDGLPAQMKWGEDEYTMDKTGTSIEFAADVINANGDDVYYAVSGRGDDFCLANISSDELRD